MTERTRRFAGGWLLVASLLLAQAAGAATYYVRTSGNDASSGLAPGAAWATVEHAADTVVAGDLVYVGGGTYTDGADFANSGTAASPIVFIADLGGAFTGDAGPVVISVADGEAVKIDQEDHIHLTGFRVSGGKKGFQVKKALGIRIESCIADGSDDHGFEIDDAEVTVTGCEVYGHGKEGISIKKKSIASLSEIVVHDNADQGIRVDDMESLELRRCEIHSNGEQGIEIRKGDATIVNCVVHGNASHAIEVSQPTSTVQLWHVTLAQNQGAGVFLDKGSVTLRNAIVAFNDGAGLELEEGTLDHAYAIVHGNAGGNYLGTAAGPAELDLDPLFVGGGSFDLQAGSPAIDVGLDASAVTSVDRDGEPRPQGGGWELGAYEEPGFHFSIEHDGAGLNCQVEPITIRAHDASHAVDAGYAGTISLSTSTGNGDWTLLAGGGTLINAGGGAGSYAFAAADSGVVVLGLRDDFAETVDVDVVDGSFTEVEDPALVFSGAGSESFRDDFGAVSYANQDGALPWAGSWIELDAAGAGPGAGNARITGGELSLEDFPNTDVDTSVEREADLSSYSNATLLFDFRTSTGVDANDAVFVEVSANGGASWTVLERITGIAGASSQSRSFDLTPHRAANTRVRFRVDGLNGTGGTSCCYGDSDEQFLLAFVEIRVPAAAYCGPDHFAILHDGSAVNCQAENVTFRVHDATHGLDIGYTGSISLSTSTGHGDWSLVTGGGSLVNAGGGNATYGFVAGDAGEVVLGLRNSFAETVDIDVADGPASESPAEDPPLVFDAAGFEFVADSVASAIGTQIAGKPSDAAPGAQSLELRAIRTNDQTGACEAALQGPEPVELAFTCEDPAACFGPQVLVNGASPIPGTGGATPGAFASVPLDFGGPADGTAPLTLLWSDAGRIRVHARRALAPSGEWLQGASNPFAVRPFALRLSADGNPGASDGAGPVFSEAGRDFTARVAAVAWQAADDADADGIADGHADTDPATGADLSDNAALPAFGRDLAPENVSLASSLVAPGGGNDPGLQGATTLSGFVGGVASSASVYFDEVGVIELRASIADGDWLGIGPLESAKILGRSGFVGRFRPDHFDVAEDTAPVWATACPAGGFTYLGQPFLYQTAPVLGVTARSTRNSQTRNYTGAPPGGFFRLTNASLGSPVYASDPGSPAPLDTSGLPVAGSDPAILDLGDGSATLTFDAGTGLRFTKTTPVAPFDAELALALSVVDADGVLWAGNPWRFADATPGNGMAWSAGKAQRYGRLRLVGAFGSELSPLPQPLRAEYWSGSGFALHGDDGCTAVPAASIGTTARSPAALATTPSVGNTPLLSGDAGLVWSAPGQPGTADTIVNLGSAAIATPFGPLPGAALPWLRYDWTTDGAGAPIEDPTARITFGIFGGQAPVIFRREVY